MSIYTPFFGIVVLSRTVTTITWFQWLLSIGAQRLVNGFHHATVLYYTRHIQLLNHIYLYRGTKGKIGFFFFFFDDK